MTIIAEEVTRASATSSFLWTGVGEKQKKLLQNLCVNISDHIKNQKQQLQTLTHTSNQMCRTW